MPKIVAITGATGFAGRHAVTELLKHGHKLVALVRDPARAQLPPEVIVIAGDLANRVALEALMAGADAVVHLAGALSGLSGEDYFATNVEGTKGLAEAAGRNGVRRFIHISSLAARQPRLSPYAASKQAGEQVVESFALEALVLRPPAVYGPGDTAMLPLFRQLTRGRPMIPGRRDQHFSLLYVEDLALIIADAVAGATTGLREVSDGRVYGWEDIVAVARDAEGRGIQPIFLPKPFVSAIAWAATGVAHMTGRSGMINRGKVNELYHGDWVSGGEGWRLADPIGFDQGFRRTVQWYREAGWLPPPHRADRSAGKPQPKDRP